LLGGKLVDRQSRLVIIGAGGFGRQIAAVVADMNARSPKWDFAGFVDDEAEGTTVEGYPIMGPVEWLFERTEKPYVLCAIGDPRIRKRIVAECGKRGVRFATIVHPSVVMSRFVWVGEGTMIMPGTVITTNVRIGKHCLINSGCRIGHDTVIEDYSSCMPATAVAGDVVLSEGCYLGIGSCVVNKANVGAWSVIGAGAAVVDDIPPGVVAVGIPAKSIKSIPL